MIKPRERSTKVSRRAAEMLSDDHQKAAHRWTFLTNHAHVLILLHADSNLILREVAIKVGITERAVQRIIQDLEEGGFLERERIGRRNHYRVIANNALRHPIESHCQVADLLEMVAFKPRKKKTAKAASSR